MRRKAATKVCHACKLRKPLTAFWRRAASPDGCDRVCGTCKGRYFRQWYIAHRDHYNRRHREYYQAHLKRLREYQREYQRRRRELMAAGKWKTRGRRERVDLGANRMRVFH